LAVDLRADRGRHMFSSYPLRVDPGDHPFSLSCRQTRVQRL
jgi:hypothetical protein